MLPARITPRILKWTAFFNFSDAADESLVSKAEFIHGMCKGEIERSIEAETPRRFAAIALHTTGFWREMFQIDGLIGALPKCHAGFFSVEGILRKFLKDASEVADLPESINTFEIARDAVSLAFRERWFETVESLTHEELFLSTTYYKVKISPLGDRILRENPYELITTSSPSAHNILMPEVEINDEPTHAEKPNWDIPGLPERLHRLASQLSKVGGKATAADLKHAINFDPARIYADYKKARLKEWIRTHIRKLDTGLYELIDSETNSQSARKK